MSVIEAKNRRLKYLIALLTAVVVFLGGFIVFSALNPKTDTGQKPSSAHNTHSKKQPPPKQQPEPEQVFANHPASMTIGDPNAPLVLREWIDMGCPYCAKFNRETLPQLKKEYVTTGKMKIEVRLVAFFEGGSERGAVAALAAATQGRFHEFINAVYAEAPLNGHPELTRAELIDFAKTAKVPDIAKFTADLDSEELAKQVATDTQVAQQLGVNSVPFFAIETDALSGAQPIETFRQFIARHE